MALYNSSHFLGYSQVGSETTAGVADKHEQFEFAPELPDLWRLGLPLYERLKELNQVRYLLVPAYHLSGSKDMLITVDSGRHKTRVS